MGNTCGQMLRVTTWGESHGDAVRVGVDGCPRLLAIDAGESQGRLDGRSARQPGAAQRGTVGPGRPRSLLAQS